MNFERFFQLYEELVKQTETAFEKVKSEYAGCVRCKEGCADCCHAIFDVTLIEALYIKHTFDQMFAEDIRNQLLERANEADRKIYRLKKQAFKDYQQGKPENKILEEMAARRVRCPLLNSQDRCDMYAVRPITCRLYGIPTVIGDRSYTCGLSGFDQGKTYPTVKLDQIHHRLYEISFSLSQHIQSRYPQLAEILVPLSMALLTDYSEDYLGVKREQDNADKK